MKRRTIGTCASLLILACIRANRTWIRLVTQRVQEEALGTVAKTFMGAWVHLPEAGYVVEWVRGGWLHPRRNVSDAGYLNPARIIHHTSVDHSKLMNQKGRRNAISLAHLVGRRMPRRVPARRTRASGGQPLSGCVAVPQALRRCHCCRIPLRGENSCDAVPHGTVTVQPYKAFHNSDFNIFPHFFG